MLKPIPYTEREKQIAKQAREDAIEECKDVVPFRIDDGEYSNGFNACSKKALDNMDKLKEK